LYRENGISLLLFPKIKEIIQFPQPFFHSLKYANEESTNSIYRLSIPISISIRQPAISRDEMENIFIEV
jgi:hypothetical protein